MHTKFEVISNILKASAMHKHPHKLTTKVHSTIQQNKINLQFAKYKNLNFCEYTIFVFVKKHPSKNLIFKSLKLSIWL